MNTRDQFRIGRRLVLPLLAAAPLFAQCPTGTLYPGALDTNTSLTVAKNNIVTTLTVQQQIADTVLIVTSTTGWVANMMAAVDTGTSIEYEYVTSVIGMNTLGVTRACESTSAIAHLVGVSVANVATAYSGHTSVAGGIIAIETALGANLANLPGSASGPVVPINKGGTGQTTQTAALNAILGTAGVVGVQGSGDTKVQLGGTNSGALGAVLCNDANGGVTTSGCSSVLPAGTQTQFLRIQPNTGNSTTLQFNALPITVANDYNFPAQSPGGALAVGANTVTLTPCPLGVAGADTNQFLQIQGGVGAPEAVAITGGSCTGTGITSGTVTFSAVNTHTGAWSIQSATAGCSEAFWSNGGTGNMLIFFPAGSYTFFAPCRLSAIGTWVVGAGPTGTTITNSTLNSEVFQFNGAGNIQGNGVHGFQLIGNASSVSGYAIEVISQNYFRASDIYILNFPQGMLLTNPITGSIRDVWTRNLVGDGFTINGSSTNAVIMDDLQTQSATAYSAGMHITQCGNCLILHSQFLAANDGMLLNPANTQSVASVDVIESYFDHGIRGIHINPAAGGSVVRFRCSQCWASSNSSAPSGGVWLDSTGGGTIAGVLFENGEFSANSGDGLHIDTGSTISIVGSNMSNNAGAGASFGGGTANASDITIVGNRIGNNLAGWGAGAQQFGLYIVPTTITNLTICGNDFLGNTSTPVNANGLMTGLTLCPNRGIDDVALPVLASAATINLTSGQVVNPNYNITGVTTVTTITGALWRGRKLTLVKTDAGSLTVGGGGNIPGTHTMTQNTSLLLTYDGTNWY
jgi:hypothetical protein